MIAPSFMPGEECVHSENSDPMRPGWVREKIGGRPTPGRGRR